MKAAEGGPPERLGVTVREAARLLGCSSSSIYNRLNAGDLKSYTLGRARRITIESIRRISETGPQR